MINRPIKQRIFYESNRSRIKELPNIWNLYFRNYVTPKDVVIIASARKFKFVNNIELFLLNKCVKGLICYNRKKYKLVKM